MFHWVVVGFMLAERLELSDTMHDIPMQTGRPNGVRSSDWLGMIYLS